MKTVIQLIASKVQARKNCIQSGNDVWKDKHEEALEELQSNLPSGSGFDCGCKIDLEKSDDKKVVISFSYHHMDEHGYDGWTDHEAIVTPEFDGISIRFTGINKNDVKDYFQDVFQDVLGREVLETVKV